MSRLVKQFGVLPKVKEEKGHAVATAKNKSESPVTRPPPGGGGGQGVMEAAGCNGHVGGTTINELFNCMTA
jgi:hypothetical protein